VHVTSRDTSRPPGHALSEQRIVAAAVELLDADDEPRFSMRRLAAALDVQAPALYPYIKSRQELVFKVIESVLGQREYVPAVSEAWDDEIRLLMREMRQEIHRHPWVTRLILAGVPPGLLLRRRHAIEQILDRAGVHGEEASVYRRLLSWLVWGFVSLETTFPHSPSYQPLRRGKDRKLAQVYQVNRPAGDGMDGSSPYEIVDVDQLFEASIDCYLAGVRRVAESTHSTSPRRKKTTPGGVR
jgi:AcrR family transcriptional regulator